MKVLSVFGVAVITLLAWPRVASAQHLTPIPHRETARTQSPARLSTVGAGSPWTPLTNQPTFLSPNCIGAANPILLTDGTVMIQDGGCPDWWRLTPDQNGSYVNGTWTQLASLPSGYSPLYHFPQCCQMAA